MLKILNILFLILIFLIFIGVASGEVYYASPDNITRVLEKARDGDTIYLLEGYYKGGIVLNKSVALIGMNYPVIDAMGGVYGILIEANNCTVEGVKIVNTSTSRSLQPAGIVLRSDYNIIRNVIMENVYYGILPQEADYNIIEDCYLVGLKNVDMNYRGDAIYLWYSKHNIIRNVTMLYFQDGIYSEHSYYNKLINNKVAYSRYAVHNMYCTDYLIDGMVSLQNIAGYVIMYSANITIRNSIAEVNWRSAVGEGIFVIETDNVLIENNTVYAGIYGMEIKRTPYRPGHYAIVRWNTIAYNQVGISVDEESAVTFYGNRFIENVDNIEAIGDIGKKMKWYSEELKVGNFWDTYAGFDKNKDGIGDLPYVERSFAEYIIDSYPTLRIFMYTPAYQALETMSKIFPISPKISVYDPYPLMRPNINLNLEKEKNVNAQMLFASIFLVLTSVLIIWRYGYGGY